MRGDLSCSWGILSSSPQTILTVSVSGCRSRSIVCISAWMTAFCVCAHVGLECEHDEGRSRYDRPSRARHKWWSTDTVSRWSFNWDDAWTSASPGKVRCTISAWPALLILWFKDSNSRNYVNQNPKVQGSGVLYKEIGTLSLNKDKALQ